MLVSTARHIPRALLGGPQMDPGQPTYKCARKAGGRCLLASRVEKDCLIGTKSDSSQQSDFSAAFQPATTSQQQQHIRGL
jgi:hypothetical protein